MDKVFAVSRWVARKMAAAVPVARRVVGQLFGFLAVVLIVAGIGAAISGHALLAAGAVVALFVVVLIALTVDREPSETTTAPETEEVNDEEEQAVDADA